MSACVAAVAAFLTVGSLAVPAQNQALSLQSSVTGGYVEVPASPTLVPANFTLEAWITYVDSGLPAGWVFPTIGRKNFVQGVAEWFLRVEAANAGNRSLRLWLNGAGGVVNLNWPFAAGALLNWTHVAATYDGATARLFINGAQVATANGTGPLVDLGASVRIGAGDTAPGSAYEVWNGMIDSVRLWSTARTAAEIASGMFQPIYAAPGLNASWHLEGDGVDASGNGNHGVVIGTPGFVTVPLPAALYETNSPGSSLDFNGAQASGLARAVTRVCSGGAVTAGSAGAAGLLWEAAFNASPTAPAGSPGVLLTPGGQILNLDIAGGLFFLLGGAIPALAPYPGPFSAVFAAGAPGTTLSFQQFNADLGNPEGFSLSQAAQLDAAAFVAPPSPLAGPTGDDTQVQVNVGCVSFYNRSFSSIFIQSNGRLMFGGGNTSFTPSTAAFATDAPSFGCWTDLNPAAGGTITLTAPAPGVLDVLYNGVVYFATTIPNTFQLQLDTNNGVASIVGLTTIAVASGQMLIGISGGSAVQATNPGLVAFSPGNAGTTGSTFNGTDMIHALGPRGAVTSGINRIDFYPNGFNNFDWISQ